MKDAKEQRKHLWIAVAIAGGGGVVLLVVHNGATRAGPPARAGSASPTRSASAQVSRHSLNFAPNPANPQLEASMIQAREGALALYDQSAVAERSAQDQYLLGLNTNATQKAISFNTNATALKETGLTTAAQQAIAQEEAQAQQAIASTQASAYQSVASGQQSTSLWQSIIGGISSIFPFLGL